MFTLIEHQQQQTRTIMIPIHISTTDHNGKRAPGSDSPAKTGTFTFDFPPLIAPPGFPSSSVSSFWAHPGAFGFFGFFVGAGVAGGTGAAGYPGYIIPGWTIPGYIIPGWAIGYLNWIENPTKIYNKFIKLTLEPLDKAFAPDRDQAKHHFQRLRCSHLHNYRPQQNRHL